MLEFIRKKLVHTFVIASIIFGCSVQAATPSFKEDLDDFEEMHYVHQEGLSVLQAEPLVILWQNEDLAQALICSCGATDDLEQYSPVISHIHFVLTLSIRPHFFSHRGLPKHPIGLSQARAPPSFL